MDLLSMVRSEDPILKGQNVEECRSNPPANVSEYIHTDLRVIIGLSGARLPDFILLWMTRRIIVFATKGRFYILARDPPPTQHPTPKCQSV